MFTGLIETTGIISNISQKGDVVQMEISAPLIAGELKPGDSVAVSGVCLTVVKNDGDRFVVEMMRETVSVTKFRDLKKGSKVNLERALRMDSRLDGHMVAGHVDGTAVVSEIDIYGRTRKYIFNAGKELIAEMIPKGSVAVDGVSLTLIDAWNISFSVGIIPTTLADTTIADLKKGDIVNIETDMVGKYVMKLLNANAEKNELDENNSLTWDKLAQYGWY